MILCQNCLHKEILGAMFCSECGAQLIYAKGVPTSVVRMTTSKLWAKQLETKSAPVPVVNTDNLISLSIISTGDCLPIIRHERGHTGPDQRGTASDTGHRSDAL